MKKHEAAVAALQSQINAAKGAIAKVKSKDADKPPKGGKAVVIAVADLPGVVVDDEQAKKVGEWKHSTTVATYIGQGYVYDLNEGKGEKTITFQPDLPHAGKYEVRLAYTPGTNRATNVPVTVFMPTARRKSASTRRSRRTSTGGSCRSGSTRSRRTGRGSC